MKKIRIFYTMIAPVSHIGGVASTGSYFQTVRTSSGVLPVITGNSVRGILRDCAALHFLNVYGKPVTKEIFNVLFSGGNISGSAKNDVERAKGIREHFPLVSLLGGGVGSMILSGNLVSGFLYPVCSESEEITGVSSEISWHELIDEIEFTRMDNAKEDKNIKHITDIEEEKKAKASTQMRFSVQYMSPGTQFVQDIALLDGATELEEAGLYTAIAKWFELPTLGGMKAKGFGRFNAESDEISVKDGIIVKSERVAKLIEEYEKFLKEDEPEKWISLLADKGAK